MARALGTGAIDVVVIKPQSMGGPDLAMRAVRLTREFGATPVVTTMIDSAIGVRHALHVAAASGATLAHGLAT
ncbi:MAG: o-succinylbenzoate synthase, partial [Acidimicrobiales bacterium]